MRVNLNTRWTITPTGIATSEGRSVIGRRLSKAEILVLPEFHLLDRTGRDLMVLTGYSSSAIIGLLTAMHQAGLVEPAAYESIAPETTSLGQILPSRVSQEEILGRRRDMTGRPADISIPHRLPETFHEGEQN